jgi:hypothetical protein
MSNYVVCLACGSCVLEAIVKNKMVCEDTCVGCICEECISTVKSFRISFTRDTPTSKFTPLTFQCLEVLKRPGKSQYDYSDGDSDN